MSLISILKKKNNKTMFTTPSHDGKICLLHKFYQWYRNDISETDACEPEIALDKCEQRAAQIYGTKYTKFLTNGSTSGIITALLTCFNNRIGNRKLLLWNNAHSCHKNGAELANCEIIEYSLSINEEWGTYKAITPEKVENLLKKYTPHAILITSPSYEGFVCDIEKISKICKENDVKLIVDEAHGALYPFSENLPTSAVKYADYTIQSLHKTAGGINPTALLHSNDLDPTEYLKKINTTSPSYPMLATIEANINFLNSIAGKNQLETLIKQIKSIKNDITNIEFCGDDITKILIKKESLTGHELSAILYEKYSIEDERTNEKSTMLLCGIGTSTKKLERLKKVLKAL